MSNVKWVFPDQESGLTDYHSIPTEKALDSELETFVREVLQNANDQGLSNGDPVKVTFEFNKLTDDIGDFLDALHWNNRPEDSENLSWHVERATQNEQARDPGLKRFLQDFENDELLVLSIHDENTTGLVGDEDDSSQPYGALVKDFGGSEKPESSSAGGSHGVGKTVLWAFSGLSTVLFNSSPHENGHGGDEPSRLIGRSILPAHESEDPNRTYTNHGWFGLDDASKIDRLGRPPSLWSDGTSPPEALRIARKNDSPGTTIGVVGFRIPGEELDPDPVELADEFKRAAAKHFWPAISRGDLEVSVQTPDGTKDEVSWADAPGVRPFVQSYEALFDIESNELDGPGSVAKTDVDLQVPEENSEVVDDPDGQYDTSVDLLVRQLNPNDKEDLQRSEDDDLSPNNVARLRGAQMIVDYVDKSSIADRGSDFVGVLVAGEAQVPNGETPTPAQSAVETFLRRSEPAQHDEWRGSKNEYLKKYYDGTIVKEIAALSGSRLENALANVVHEDIESGDDVPGTDDVAPVMDGRSTDENGGGPPAMEWESRPNTSFRDGRWEFDGVGSPASDDHGPWSVTLSIDRMDVDESASQSIPIESVRPKTPGVSVSHGVSHVELQVPASVDKIDFEGKSEQITNGNVEEAFEIGEITKVRLDVSAEIEEGGTE